MTNCSAACVLICADCQEITEDTEAFSEKQKVKDSPWLFAFFQFPECYAGWITGGTICKLCGFIVK